MSEKTETSANTSAETFPSFSRLGLDCLRSCFLYIDAKSSTRLFLAGDKWLNRMITLGAIEQMDWEFTNALPHQRQFPHIVSKLSSLKKFRYVMISSILPPVGATTLLKLPQTLTDLNINITSDTSLFPDLFDVNHPEWTLAHHFTRLVALEIGGTSGIERDLRKLDDLPRFFPVSLTKLHVGPVFNGKSFKALTALPNLVQLRMALSYSQEEDEEISSVAFPPQLTSLTVMQGHLSMISNAVKLESLTHLKFHQTYQSNDNMDPQYESAFLSFPKNLTHLELQVFQSPPLTLLRHLPPSLTHLNLYQPQSIPYSEVTGTLPRGLKTFELSTRSTPSVDWYRGNSLDSKQDLLIECFKTMPQSITKLSNFANAEAEKFRDPKVIRAFPRSLTKLDGIDVQTEEALAALPDGIAKCTIQSDLLQNESNWKLLPNGLTNLSLAGLALPLNLASIIKSHVRMREIEDLDLECFAEILEDCLEDGTKIPFSSPISSSDAALSLDTGHHEVDAEKTAEKDKAAAAGVDLPSTPELPPYVPTITPVTKQGVAYLDLGRFAPPYMYLLHLLAGKQSYKRYIIDASSLGVYNSLRKFHIHSADMNGARPVMLAGNVEFRGLSAFTHLESVVLRGLSMERPMLHELLRHLPLVRVFRFQHLLYPLLDEDLAKLPRKLSLLCIQGVDTLVTPQGIGLLPPTTNTIVIPTSPLGDWEKAGLTKEQAVALLPPSIRRIHFGWPFGSSQSSSWREAINDKAAR